MMNNFLTFTGSANLRVFVAENRLAFNFQKGETEIDNSSRAFEMRFSWPRPTSVDDGDLDSLFAVMACRCFREGDFQFSPLPRC
jgi:hypothetical protein